MNAQTTLYLLNCSCGHPLKVAVSQAGDELSCSCGRNVIVPRLRELTKLPVAPSNGGDTIPHLPAKWSRWKGALFATGLPITVLALGFAIHYVRLQRAFKIERPVLSDMKYAVNMMDLNPSDAWTIWKEISADRLPPRPQNNYIARRDAARLMEERARIAFGIALFGAVLAVVAFILPASVGGPPGKKGGALGP
jgi:hypothetical protein